MSDQLILGIITAACTLVATVFASYMAFKVAQLTKLANKTHDILNSMSIILARRLAVATDKLATADATEANIEGAKDAAKALAQAEQVQKQIATPPKD